jgi:predicted enzyme related to lactoylglutathione lyase
MDYWVITTTDYKGNKALGGGIMKRLGPQQPIINHIDVKSIDEYSSKVQQLGGKVHVPKTAVPGMGYFAICLDTENMLLEYGRQMKTQSESFAEPLLYLCLIHDSLAEG